MNPSSELSFSPSRPFPPARSVAEEIVDEHGASSSFPSSSSRCSSSSVTTSRRLKKRKNKLSKPSVHFNLIPTLISVAPMWVYCVATDDENDDAASETGDAAAPVPLVSVSSWIQMRRMVLAELAPTALLQPRFAALRTMSNVLTHNAHLIDSILEQDQRGHGGGSGNDEVVEELLDGLFRFICVHTQDDTLAASRRVVADGALADAVHIASIGVGARRSLSTLLSWFIRQATFGALSTPDLSSGLIRAARRSCPPVNSSDIALNVLTQMETAMRLHEPLLPQKKKRSRKKLPSMFDRSARQKHLEGEHHHHHHHDNSTGAAAAAPRATVYTSCASSMFLGSAVDMLPSAAAGAPGGAAASSIILGGNNNSSSNTKHGSKMLDPHRGASVRSIHFPDDDDDVATGGGGSPFPPPSSASSGCVFVQVGEGSSTNISAFFNDDGGGGGGGDGGDASNGKKQQRRQTEFLSPALQVAHEMSLLDHHRQTKELTCWVFLLLHNAVFHPKVSGTGASGGVGDLIESALALASAICPRSRFQAGEARSTLGHISSSSNSPFSSLQQQTFSSTSSELLTVEARAVLTSGLVIALAWARIRGAAADDKDILMFTRHFHGLAQNVDAAVGELHQRCSGSSMAEWMAAGLVNTWPSISRWLGASDTAPDGGISEFVAGRVPKAGLPRLQLVGCWCEHS